MKFFCHFGDHVKGQYKRGKKDGLWKDETEIMISTDMWEDGVEKSGQFMVKAMFGKNIVTLTTTDGQIKTYYSESRQTINCGGKDHSIFTKTLQTKGRPEVRTCTNESFSP